MYDLLIKNAEVFYKDEVQKLDIAIVNSKIAKIEKKIDESKSFKTINAQNLLALPGGIDSHVHISQPSGPDVEMADDFTSATKAAAAGGNTFVIPFALQNRGDSIRSVVQNYHKLANGNCYIDYAFHLIISDVNPKILGQELPALIKDGYTSLKLLKSIKH
jgi:dihydropyrimidinase